MKSCGVEPIGDTGIACRDDQRHRSVRVRAGLGEVERRGAVEIVKLSQPAVGQLH